MKQRSEASPLGRRITWYSNDHRHPNFRDPCHGEVVLCAEGPSGLPLVGIYDRMLDVVLCEAGNEAAGATGVLGRYAVLDVPSERVAERHRDMFERVCRQFGFDPDEYRAMHASGQEKP